MKTNIIPGREEQTNHTSRNEKNTGIRTRFAPSPTGELHIGGVRTALFNYLLSKKMGGKFILRVEDTDQHRNKEEFIHQQYQDLVWLGCEPDESPFREGSYGPYQQSQRLVIYQKYLRQLLAEKKAYYCFCSPAELAQEKAEFQKRNLRSNYQYSRKCLKLTREKLNSLLREQQNYVIRFRVNQENNYQLVDLVRGKIIFPGKDIEDFVLCRSNGTPLLNFAVVIDDHTMKISHILRGEEHLSNTAKQLVLYEALGWIPPQFGHLSLILNQARQKLSKRDQATSQFQLIRQLRELGYLPMAIVNYLLFLGWHPGTTKEIFTWEEATKEFNFAGLHARGAVYSPDKLNWYNKYYIQNLAAREFAEYSWLVLKKAYELPAQKKDWAVQIAKLFRSQLNYFQELVSLTAYFFRNLERKIKIGEREILWCKELSQELSRLDKWETENIKSVFKSVCLNQQVSPKEFYPLMRNILTGEDRGPELPQIILLLGKEIVLRRLGEDKIA